MISSVKTREWLEKLGMPRLKESLDFVPKQVADLRRKLETSTDESELAILRGETFRALEEYKKEMTPPRVTLPSMTFGAASSSTAAGREVHLLFLGRAHSG